MGINLNHSHFIFSLVLAFFVLVGFFLIPEIHAQEPLFSWGSEGSEDGEFNNPFGIAVDSKGNVYVGDTGNKRIQKFDSSGKYLNSTDSIDSEEGQFIMIYGMAFDSKDNLYVIDGGSSDRIQKFSSELSFLKEWEIRLPDDKPFLNPIGIAVDSKDLIYVLEAANSRIQVFDAEGKPQTIWNIVSPMLGEFENPRGIAIGSSDIVYIVELDNGLVHTFNTTGSSIDTLGYYVWELEQIPNPFGIVIGSEENVYVSYSSNIIKYTSDGSFLAQLGSFESEINQFDSTRNIAVDPPDTLYVVDSGNNRISVFSQKEIQDNDFDNDGIENSEDNCPYTYNPSQKKLSRDPSIGILCAFSESYKSPEDDYDDTYPEDNCPYTYNPDQKDLDEDGLGDNCDPFPEDKCLEGCEESRYWFSMDVTPIDHSTNLGKSVDSRIQLYEDPDTEAGMVFLVAYCGERFDCVFDNEVVFPPDSSRLTIQTKNSTGVGQSTIQIEAIGGGGKEFGTINMEIAPNKKPTAIISPISPGKVNELIIFNGTNSEDDGKITDFLWNFGDQSPIKKGAVVNHTYQEAKEWTVQLTVQDNNGGTSYATEKVTIDSAIGISTEFLVATIIGIIGVAGTIVGILISLKKREGNKHKRKDIPPPKESKLK